MPPQVSKDEFLAAMAELGHNPDVYRGKKLSLSHMCKVYDLEQDSIIEAIDRKFLTAHYDYFADTIWIDALDAAHFFYCIKSNAAIFPTL